MDHDKEKPKKKRGRKTKKDKPTISKTGSDEEVKVEDIDGYDSSFSIKTVQSGAMRIFFMSLKKYCEIITLNITSEGITIIEIVDPVLIHSNLYHQNFEEYTVDKDIKLHINLETFYNIIRYVKNDYLTFQKNKSEKFWSFIVYNDDNKTRNKYDINLIGREYIKPEISAILFNFEFTFPCKDFKDLFKKTKNLQSDKLTVEFIDEGTTLSALFICKNSEVTSETKIITKHTGNTDGTLFSGIFPYKKIALCTHFSDLCNTISLYAKDDYPLIIKYTVANLGNIKFCFAPIEIEKVFTIMN